ncbi:MAG TPA: tRNA (adenosine(37)-N6)-threonylcarbamoyltransferase complex ATPase subunit type 1 TsaE [Candidatus Binatia bacterium]|nr:tRNA (adenosine(37)-N6)-threonylcarbamoyltransferase complex ATPase subunit type 1 TsaE [Candidatus Binatia bacterium]
MAVLRLLSTSPRQTRTWGARLGTLLEGGEIIGLIGELGTGKTCFVRGLSSGLEVGEEAWIRSPSFTLINEYHGRLPVYHIDLYRIGGRDELEGLNLRDYLYSDGVSLIEWFEHLPAGEVDEFLELKLAYADGNKRELIFTPHGERYERIVERLKIKSVK